MKEPLIKTAANGKEKQTSYVMTKVNYRRAIRGGFYGEALLIDYAIIEDRLKSFLYYSGGMIEKNNPNVEIDNPFFIDAYNLTSDRDKNGKETGRIVVRDISRKIWVITKMLKRIEMSCDEDEYLRRMKKALGSETEIKDFRGSLNSFEKKWIPKRNEVIHGLLNKNAEDLYSKYKDICEDGMKFADYFDNTIRRFKERADIRKFLGLKVEQ